MAQFLRFLSHLTAAQLHAVVAYLEALARNSGRIGHAVYCGPKNLHDARTYTGPCA
jgi:hypothetical protein